MQRGLGVIQHPGPRLGATGAPSEHGPSEPAHTPGHTAPVSARTPTLADMLATIGARLT